MINSLSIVVPAYNEGARLGKSLPAIVAYLEDYGADCEVIVVDDGSTDNTADAAREALSASAKVRTSVISYQSNLGKGRAVRLGLLASRGSIALFMDADLSTPITETPRLVDPIASGECKTASDPLDMQSAVGSAIRHVVAEDRDVVCRRGCRQTRRVLHLGPQHHLPVVGEDRQRRAIRRAGRRRCHVGHDVGRHRIPEARR